MRVLTDPTQTGAVVLSLPQDVQSHAYDWPVELFEEREWVIRRPVPDSDEVTRSREMLHDAERPLIIAGGGVIYSGATPELEALASAAGIPVAETFAGKGAVQQRAWWQLGGIGLEGTPATNELAASADLVLTVGSRLTDFATASQSLFQNRDVRFASINVDGQDAGRLGATAIIATRSERGCADSRRRRAASRAPRTGSARYAPATTSGRAERAAALDPDRPFDKSTVPADSDVVTDTPRCSPKARSSASCRSRRSPETRSLPRPAGRRGPAKGMGRHRAPLLPLGVRLLLHGLEIPAGLGVRLAVPDRSKRVISLSETARF